MNILNYERHTDYVPTNILGTGESYEREFYDMARSTMIKYDFQATLGDMNGIFVAYHNTRTFVGFEYLTREVMDKHLFGSTQMAKAAFAVTIELLQVVLKAIVQHFPDESFKLTFIANGGGHGMTFFAKGLSSGKLNRFDLHLTYERDGQQIHHPVFTILPELDVRASIRLSELTPEQVKEQYELVLLRSID